MFTYNTNLPMEELERRFRAISKNLPRIAGSVVVNFALGNFRKQGFQGASFQAWKPRKEFSKWGTKSKASRRALLVKTGRLRRSIRVTKADWEAVQVGADVPYAQVHNEGLRVGQIQKVGAFTRKLTKLGTVQGKTLKTRSKISFGRSQTGTTTVQAHTRRINQNIPARPYLKDSPYLQRDLQRVIAAAIMKGLKKI